MAIPTYEGTNPPTPLHGVRTEYRNGGIVYVCTCGFETDPHRSHENADSQMAEHIQLAEAPVEDEPLTVEAPVDEEEREPEVPKATRRGRKRVEAEDSDESSEEETEDGDSDEQDEEGSDEQKDEESGE